MALFLFLSNSNFCSDKLGSNNCNTHITRYLKIGQLIEYKTENNFLEKSCTKCDGGISLRPFLKKSKLSMSVDQQFEASCSLFSLYVEVEDYQNILKLRYSSLAFTSYKAFLINKKRSENSSPVSFSIWFLKKNMFHVMFYSINWRNFIVWLALLFETFGNMFIVIVYNPVCDVINF